MRMMRITSLVLIAALLTGCATGRAMRKGQSAAQRGDWDAAVAYYRQVLAADPGNVEARIAMERTTRLASADHLKRARDLEAQNQLGGAVAEYRLAAELDPSNTLAVSKAIELERRIREQIEAARPQPRIDTIRQQAAQTSPIPRIDPRTAVPQMRYPNASVRELLTTISQLTGINVTYDQGLDSQLQRPYPLDIQQTPLEQVLNQILTANQLTFKVIDQRTIFVYQDNPTNRQKYEDQYTQTFYVSNADVAELVQIINQMVSQGSAVRPLVYQSKSSNSIVVRATAPVMGVIENLIRGQDKPKPEVLVEGEILEVDRSFIRKLGLDLSQYALGLTFSPELAPPNVASIPNTFPTMPPPFNLNTISRGLSPADFYATVPTFLIQLLESDTRTRVLAKPSLLGRDGVPVTLRLGDQVPIPQTSFNAAAAGGVATIPTTSVQYQPVGINLYYTPRVTYQDEIILDALTLSKSGLGQFLVVAGQSFPTIIERTAQTSIRLRDGESTLIAGLLRDEDRKAIKSFPGFTQIPFLRSLFGNSDIQNDQTDVVMVLTTHIIQGHALTPADLRPMYVGTGQNLGAGLTPTLISPDAIGIGGGAPGAAAPGAPAGAAPPTTPPPGAITAETPPATAQPAAPTAPATPPRAVGVVPIQPVGGAATAPPPTAQGPVRVIITAPTAPEGGLTAGGGPHTVPIQIFGATDVVSLSLSITFDPAVLKPLQATAGSFMASGGVTPTFVPRVDANTGRVDLVFSRPASQPGASNTAGAPGLVAAISLMAGTAGTTQMAISGVATTSTGATIPLQFTPATVVVR